MSGQGRLGDKANVTADSHGCPGCPHAGVGPAISGSADVMVNGRPALRVDDVGIHAICCGPNMWTAKQGSSSVFINGKAAFRMNDPTKHCGGDGKLIEGSSDVIVGDGGGGGGGSGGAGSGSGASSSGGGGGTSGSSQAPTAASAASSSSAAATPASQPTDFVEVELVDEAGLPVAGCRVRVTPASGEPIEATTDARGVVRIETVPRGSVRISFPELDQGAWRRR